MESLKGAIWLNQLLKYWDVIHLTLFAPPVLDLITLYAQEKNWNLLLMNLYIESQDMVIYILFSFLK
jgi:hypothetical protein